jgi:hypothetical protein
MLPIYQSVPQRCFLAKVSDKFDHNPSRTIADLNNAKGLLQ